MYKLWLPSLVPQTNEQTIHSASILIAFAFKNMGNTVFLLAIQIVKTVLPLPSYLVTDIEDSGQSIDLAKGQ